MVISFVCLVPVRLLRPNMAVLYHVNGKLQRAYHSKMLKISEKEQIRSIYSLSCLINKGLRSQFRMLDIEQGQTKERLLLSASGRNESQHSFGRIVNCNLFTHRAPRGF